MGGLAGTGRRRFARLGVGATGTRDGDTSVSDGSERARGPSLVVGLGASAGGLEALQAFFANMPPDSGFAFVIVTHQAPHRASLLPLLIGKRTAMPVVEVSDGMAVERGPRVRGAAGAQHGPAQRAPALVRARHRGVAAPAHRLLLPLARAGSERARGRHRALGHRHRRHAGAQGDQGARSASPWCRPRATRALPACPTAPSQGDSPDLVLPVAELPRAAARLRRRACCGKRVQPSEAGDTERSSDALSQIFVLLRQHTGHDFSGYKESTVRRRIERRMNLQRVATSRPSTPRYLQYDARRDRPAVRRAADRRHLVLSRSGGVRGAGRRCSASTWPTSPTTTGFVSGWPAAPPARRRTRSRSCLRECLEALGA